MQLPKILILTLRPLHNGPRIIREIQAFKSDFEIVAVGLTKPDDQKSHFYSIESLQRNVLDRIIRKAYRLVNSGRLPRFPLPVMKRFLDSIVEKERPDLVITHEPDFFPYLIPMKSKFEFKVVYNAHEYHPLQFDSNKRWLNTIGFYYNKLYQEYLKEVDLLINVCDGIAVKCKEEFGKPSLVIPNASWYHEISPYFNKEDKDESQVRIIHHGLAIRERKIEYMIEAVKLLSNSYRLDLILMPGDLDYIKELKELTSGHVRINIIEPVPFDKIVPFLNKYDIGLFNLPPLTFNYRNALPNKLFEFIQARLCLVVSPSPEMKKIVERYGVGFVANGYEARDIYECLDKISLRDINECKMKSHEAARTTSAENYYHSYVSEVKELVQ